MCWVLPYLVVSAGLTCMDSVMSVTVSAARLLSVLVSRVPNTLVSLGSTASKQSVRLSRVLTNRNMITLRTFTSTTGMLQMCSVMPIPPGVLLLGVAVLVLRPRMLRRSLVTSLFIKLKDGCVFSCARCSGHYPVT